MAYRQKTWCCYKAIYNEEYPIGYMKIELFDNPKEMKDFIEMNIEYTEIGNIEIESHEIKF